MGTKRIQIIGAGFSGLTAAFFLLRAGFKPEIFESQSRVGGLIRTDQGEHGLVEWAASSIRATALLESLSQELGVELCPAKTESKKRYIYRGKPRQWPLNARETIGLCARLPYSYLRRKGSLRPQKQESVEKWATGVLGAPSARYILQPGLQGIYVGDFSRLSAKLTMGSMFDSKVSRPARGKLRGVVAPKRGVGELINKLVDYLKIRGVPIHLEQTGDNTDPKVPTLFCGSMHAAGKFLRDRNKKVSEELLRQEMISISSVTLFFPKSAEDWRGFGCLVPREFNYAAKGILFNDQIFPYRGEHRSETWIFDGLIDHTDEEILNLVYEERKQLFGGTERVESYQVCRAQDALPHYTTELEQFLDGSFESSLRAQNIYLHGNYLGKIGLAAILERSATLPKTMAI